MAVGRPIIFLFLAMSGTVAFGSSFDTGTTAKDPEPQFVGVIRNITAVVGDDVTLDCVVDAMGKDNVLWINENHHNLLTIQFHVITRNPRISVSYDRDRTWSLHIRNVTECDSGHYLCLLNTSPMKDSVGILKVIVPPSIWMPETVVRATLGTDVTLQCEVESKSKSVTFWTREDDEGIIVSNNRYNVALTDTGEHKVMMTLIIKNIFADDVGSYRCVARNKAGVTERTITIYVAPIILMPETFVKASIGTNVTLDCEVESNPKSVTYWTRDDRGIIIISDNKYNSVLTNTDEHKVRMRLIIKNLCADDFGSYRCVARNKAGETEGTITIYDPTLSREGLPSSTASIDG